MDTVKVVQLTYYLLSTITMWSVIFHEGLTVSAINVMGIIAFSSHDTLVRKLTFTYYTVAIMSMVGAMISGKPS